MSVALLSRVGLLTSVYLTRYELGYTGVIEAMVIHAGCRWCVVSAVVVTLIFLFSIVGLRQAR